MNPKNKLAPLFEAQLELLEPDMVFCPSLDPNEENGFMSMINKLIQDILKMSTLIQRIDPTKKDSYETQIIGHQDVIEMKEEILNGIERVINVFLTICFSLKRVPIDNMFNFDYLRL